MGGGIPQVKYLFLLFQVKEYLVRKMISVDHVLSHAGIEEKTCP